MLIPASLTRAVSARLAEWRGDRSGVAAVEFALILPLMITMYLGTAQVTQALMANRKVAIAARALSDLTAQQANGVSITDAQLTDVFNAASAVMAPFATTTMKMTITSVEFVANAKAANGYDAKPRWTITKNGGTQRPCAILTPTTGNSSPGPSTLPSGVYQSGGIVIADVAYTYQPTFGGSTLAWSTTDSVLTFNQSTYMRPRSWTSYITYSGSSGKSCPTY